MFKESTRSIFGTTGQERRQYAPPPQPAMSATALLQKAAQMGAAASNASLSSLGIMAISASLSTSQEWSGQQIKPDGVSSADNLGLGLACNGSSGHKELMLGTPSVFGPKHTTLDLLGLGMVARGSSTGGLLVLMATITGGLNIAITVVPPVGEIGEYGSNDVGRSS